MRYFRYLFLSAALLAIPAVASATVIFSDGFSGNNNQFLGETGSVGNFNVAGGTNVDFLAPNIGVNQGYGSFSYLCTGVTSCVDLGGTGNPGGTSNYGYIHSNVLFQPGKYALSFSATGSERGPASILFVQFGSYSFDFTLPSNGSKNVFNALVVVSGAPSDLTFGSVDGSTVNPTVATSDNQGPILNSVSVSNTPEPSSLLLMGSGMLSGLGMMMRRRRV